MILSIFSMKSYPNEPNSVIAANINNNPSRIRVMNEKRGQAVAITRCSSLYSLLLSSSLSFILEYASIFLPLPFLPSFFKSRLVQSSLFYSKTVVVGGGFWLLKPKDSGALFTVNGRSDQELC